MEKHVDYVKQFELFLLITVAITAIGIGASFFPLWVNLPVNVAIPIVILVRLRMVMFERLKLSTLLLMRILIIFPVLGLMQGNLYVRIVLAFLFINIAEATFTDLLKNRMYFNFVSGLFLAASVFFLGGTWYADVAGPFSCIYTSDVTHVGGSLFLANGVNSKATVAWVIAYTIWNWLFVIGEFSPSVAYLHVGILSAPLVSMLAFGNPGYWLVFRANSLTAGGIFQIWRKDFVEETLQNGFLARSIRRVKGRPCQIVLMIVNLCLIAYTAYAYFA